MSDKINPLSDDVAWSAKAAAGDALERAPHSAPILCVWLDETGHLKYTKANTDLKFASIIAVWAMEWAVSFWKKK